MKRYTAFIWLLVFTVESSLAQVNLVPNGSFEVMDTCPPYSSCSNGNLHLATGWYSPNNCSPDFRHTCGYPNGCYTEPGFPADGEGIAAMIIYSGYVGPGPGTDAREYLAISLTEELQMDSAYHFSLKLRLGNIEIGRIGSIGAYFSPDSVTNYIDYCAFLDVQPQLQRNPNLIIHQVDSWVLWEDTLIAAGGEKFVTLGNFLRDSVTPHFQPGWQPTCLFAVDDVQLTPITLPKPNSIESRKIQFSISPNPTAETFFISNKGNLKGELISIYSIDGKLIDKKNFKKEVDVSELAEGIYIVKLLFGDETEVFDRLIISR